MSVASDGSSSKLLEVEEHAFANAGRWWREAGDMEVHVVHLADSASDTGTIEISYEIDVMAGQVGVMSEMTLVKCELEGAVMRVT